MKKYIMLTPGPANISDRVAKAQLNVFTCHREKNFVDLMRRVRNNLVKIANGTKDYTSVLFTSSGTGAVESAISSCIDDSSKALILNNGPYCQRMTDIEKIY